MKKAAPAPAPKKRVETAPGPAEPPSKAQPASHPTPLPKKKGWFRMSDMIGKKPAAAPAPEPKPETAPKPMGGPAAPRAGVFAGSLPACVRLPKLGQGSVATERAGHLITVPTSEPVPAPAPAPVPLSPGPEIKEAAIDAEMPKIIKTVPLPVQAEVKDDGMPQSSGGRADFSAAGGPASGWMSAKAGVPPEADPPKAEKPALPPTFPHVTEGLQDDSHAKKKTAVLKPASPIQRGEPASPRLDELALRSLAEGGSARLAIQRDAPASPTQRGEPGATSLRLPEAESVSRYEESRVGIYAVCRQFGIEVPEDKNAIIEQARECLVTVFRKILSPAPDKFMIWPMIKSIASDIEGFVATNTAILNVVHRNRVGKEKLIWHCIYTAILAMGIAKNEKNLGCTLYEIGGAALLHDIGFLLQTNGYEKLEDENGKDFGVHFAKGMDLARRIEVPEIVLEMIEHHHGRLDGKGYPKNLTRATFPRCSQILAIANIAELAITDITIGTEDDKPGNASGITRFFNEYRRAFEVDLLKKMITLVGFYPAGSVVELNNHSICKVVKQNLNFPLRPVVQVIVDGTGAHPEEEKLIDLKEVKILSIIRALTSAEISNIL